VAEEAAEEEEDAGTPRRDPSEKQEPHTVMWGINLNYIMYIKFIFLLI